MILTQKYWDANSGDAKNHVVIWHHSYHLCKFCSFSKWSILSEHWSYINDCSWLMSRQKLHSQVKKLSEQNSKSLKDEPIKTTEWKSTKKRNYCNFAHVCQLRQLTIYWGTCGMWLQQFSIWFLLLKTNLRDGIAFQ